MHKLYLILIVFLYFLLTSSPELITNIFYLFFLFFTKKLKLCNRQPLKKFHKKKLANDNIFYHKSFVKYLKRIHNLSKKFIKPKKKKMK